jgi:hypothetical protein
MSTLSERGQNARAKFSLPQDDAAFLVLNIHDPRRTSNFVVRPHDTLFMAISNQKPEHIVSLVQDQHAITEKNGERLSMIIVPADQDMADGQTIHVVGALNDANDQHIYKHLRNALAVHADENGVEDGGFISTRKTLDKSIFDLSGVTAENPFALAMAGFHENSVAQNHMPTTHGVPLKFEQN